MIPLPHGRSIRDSLLPMTYLRTTRKRPSKSIRARIIIPGSPAMRLDKPSPFRIIGPLVMPPVMGAGWASTCLTGRQDVIHPNHDKAALSTQSRCPLKLSASRRPETVHTLPQHDYEIMAKIQWPMEKNSSVKIITRRRKFSFSFRDLRNDPKGLG
jgi:hypothetical protein